MSYCWEWMLEIKKTLTFYVFLSHTVNGYTLGTVCFIIIL